MERIRMLVQDHRALIPWLLLFAVGGLTFLVLQSCVLRLLR
jgi:hypothetical protein